MEGRRSPLPPVNIEIPAILMTFKPYVLDTKLGRFPEFQLLSMIVSPRNRGLRNAAY